MSIFDLIIIGGGPAGYLAAERAANSNLNVLVIEQNSLGGVCLNEGCIPSKSLLQCAKVFEHAKDGSEFGVSASDAQIDQDFVVKRKNRIVKKLVAGVKGKLKRAGVTVLNAKAEITGKSDQGFTVSAEGETYTGKYLLIATGSAPIVPPITGVKEGLEFGRVLTNKEILDLTEVPTELVVIGGGVIGLEMASYYNSVGSKVTVIEMLDQIAGQTDKGIAKILQGNYEKKGIEFHLESTVTEVTDSSVKYEQNGETFEISASIVLLSVGRKAVTQGLGLESIGVETDIGAVVTTPESKTNVENVYAAGDVNGKSLLAHTAYREAEVAINNILGISDSLNPRTIPSVIYTSPEVASVGETEQTAEQKGLDIKVAQLPMAFSGRYMAEDERGNGICKLILDSNTNTLLGAHLIGPYVSEIIYGAAVLIETQIDIDNMKKIVFPHPSVSEIIRETLFEF